MNVLVAVVEIADGAKADSVVAATVLFNRIVAIVVVAFIFCLVVWLFGCFDKEKIDENCDFQFYTEFSLKRCKYCSLLIDYLIKQNRQNL